MPGVGNGAGVTAVADPAAVRAHRHTGTRAHAVYGPTGTEPSPHATSTATANHPFRQIP